MTEEEKLKVLHDDTNRYKEIAHEVRSFMNRQDAGRFCRSPLRKHLQKIQEMIGAELIRTESKPTSSTTQPKED